MKNFLYKYNKDINNRAATLFNDINAELFEDLYIINPKAINIRMLPFDVTLENVFALSKTWSLENERWLNAVEIAGLKNIRNKKENLKYFQSSVILSNDNNGTFYLIYLFLNPQKYNLVNNKDFLDNIINSFLAFYSKEIQFGNNLSDKESAKQLIYTEAAANYLSEIVSIIYGNRNDLFYRNLLSLSTKKYESAVTEGKKILLGEQISESNLLFEDKINISENLRMARKALQLTNENTFIICDSIYFIGLHYKTKKNYDNSYFIEFKGYNSFSLYKGLKEKLIDVKAGMPSFPQKKTKELEKIPAYLKSINPSLSETQIEKLKNTINSIARCQTHGAVVVIEDNAVEEAERLKNISTKIKDPVTVKSNNGKKYRTFAEMDGAILLDFNAYCHSFGVILDGRHVQEEGNKERGSRYNSSLRYLRQNQKKSKTLIIVMSEDGDIDILK